MLYRNSGYITINTTVLAEDCVVARMAKLVEEAQNNKCKTQRYIDECAKYYTPGKCTIKFVTSVLQYNHQLFLLTPFSSW